MKTRAFIFLAVVVMLLIGAGLAWGYTESSSNNFFGTGAGFNTYGPTNTFVGANAGWYMQSGHANTFLGFWAGYANNGSWNTFLGNYAGYGQGTTGSFNVFIGNGAGYNETGSNKLYIDNCANGLPCTSPFIYGEFDKRILLLDGKLGVGQIPSTELDVNGTVTATTFSGNGSELTNVNASTVTNGVYTTGSYANLLGLLPFQETK